MIIKMTVGDNGNTCIIEEFVKELPNLLKAPFKVADECSLVRNIELQVEHYSSIGALMTSASLIVENRVYIKALIRSLFAQYVSDLPSATYLKTTFEVLVLKEFQDEDEQYSAVYWFPRSGVSITQ